jgi:hypothetical protein
MILELVSLSRLTRLPSKESRYTIVLSLQRADWLWSVKLFGNSHLRAPVTAGSSSLARFTGAWITVMTNFATKGTQCLA